MNEYDVPEGHKSGFVTIIGRPNVGKSTLLNGFLQEKIAIATPKPQTTRTRQLGILTTDDYQIVFIDTPGMMKPRHKLDEFMMDTAVESLQDADLILWLVDVSEPVGAGDSAIARTLQALEGETPVILAMNKGDLLKAEEVLPHSSNYRSLLPSAEWIVFSAINGNGRDELLQIVVAALPEGPRFYPEDQVTDIYVREMAAEFIREQLMLQLRDEIPYGTAVEILEFKERDNGTTYISANIFVERDSHKPIILGKKGQQLKQIGAAARQQLEALVEGKVFLELWVKVEPKWRHDERALKRFGYVKAE